MEKRSDLLRARGRQLLHWATGDRRGEAEALVDEAHAEGAELSVEDADDEVRRLHGDQGIGTKDSTEPDVAEIPREPGAPD